MGSWCKSLFIAIILGVFVLSNPLQAQDTTYVPLDTNYVETVNNLRQSKDFSYMKVLDSTLRNPAKETVKKEVSRSFDLASLLNSKGTILFFKLLAIAFVLFLAYRFLIYNKFFQNDRKIAKTSDTEDNPNERLVEIEDYDELIKRAESAADTGLAIKYQYLKSLKLLSDGEWIQFSPDKTNTIYLNELKNHPMRDSFEKLTRIFEYSFYGHVPVGPVAYQKISHQFNQFFQGL